MIAEMDQARIENLKKVRTELEVCYEKERQEILANLKTELDERKRELLELRNQEMGKLENEHERNLSEEKLSKLNEYELRKQHNEKIETLKKELDKELEDIRNELRMQQREKISKFTEDHEQCLAEILRDFRMDVSLKVVMNVYLSVHGKKSFGTAKKEFVESTENFFTLTRCFNEIEKFNRSDKSFFCYSSTNLCTVLNCICKLLFE